MTNKQPDDKDGMLDLLKKLWWPVAGFIGAVTLIYNFYKMWLGDQGTVTAITACVGLIILVIVFGWVIFSNNTVPVKSENPLLAPKKIRASRYSVLSRRLAFIGVGLLAIGIMRGSLLVLMRRQEMANKLVVVIATFEGPEDVYGIRNEIVEKLNADFVDDPLVEIRTANETITPDSNSGSSRARELGNNFQADIVIWGWYRPTENPNIMIHIENLASQDVLPLGESTTLQPSTSLAELEAFSFQQQIGQETSALISFLTGLIDYGTEEYPNAIERFNKALNASPASPQIIKNQADIYFSRANAYYKGHDVQHAIKDYEHAIQINPRYPEAYNNRGLAYTDLGEYQGAIQDFERVIQIDPQDVAAFNNRGLAYADLAEYQRAIQDYEHAIQIDPQVADPYYNRGLAYAGLGEYLRAIDDFERAVQIDPDYMEAYINRGNAYAELEEYELAIQDYRWALQIDPQNADAYYNRGIAFAKMGDYQLAIQDFERAIQINPMYADAYHNRGVVNRTLGKYAEAEADFQKYEELTGEKP